jgi:hypothetical protein
MSQPEVLFGERIYLTSSANPGINAKKAPSIPDGPPLCFSVSEHGIDLFSYLFKVRRDEVWWPTK